jgi:hypothetical protein
MNEYQLKALFVKLDQIIALLKKHKRKKAKRNKHKPPGPRYLERGK